MSKSFPASYSGLQFNRFPKLALNTVFPRPWAESKEKSILIQGGRTWQPFVGGKNGHGNFRQARIYNFRDKCVFLRVIANLQISNMQYIPCNSALLAQETLFLTQKGTFLPKNLQKVSKSRQNSVCLCLKFLFESKLFGRCHQCSRATSATLGLVTWQSVPHGGY